MKPADLWERAATVAIVACGVVLSIVWALTVPIFENPDEGAHFDYVLGIRAAGRPLLAREGPATLGDSQAYTFLDAASGLEHIAFRPTAHVPPDYGSSDWIAHVDSEAPPLDRAAYRTPRHPVPALVTTYPPGYYAPAALWMALAQRVRPGLVEGFFAVRFFSVFIFMLTLFAAAALMRELRVERVTRLLLLATLAFFPLCTFVSAAVQPDVLVGLLLTVLVHRCIVYRREPTLRTMLPVAALLAASCLVKPVYTVPGLMAFGLLAIDLAVRRRAPARRVGLHAALAAAAFGLAYALDRIVSYQPASLAAFSSVPALPIVAPQAALAHGGAAFVAYVVGTLTSSVQSFFFDGGAQSSYWGVFGWLDAPLRFFVPQLDLWGGAAAFAFRVLVAGFGVLTFGAVALRCIALARRSPQRALSTFLNDVPLTLLLLFDAAMLGIALAMPDLGYQGRYWYPVIVLSMIASVRYGPRLIPFVGQRTTLQRALAAWLCAWSLVASHGAAQTIRTRYYTISEWSGPTHRRLALAPDAAHRPHRPPPDAILWTAAPGRGPA